MQYPNLILRMLAIFYDSLILISIWFAGTYIALCFNHGQAFGSDSLMFKCYLLSISSWFTLWFWTHGGQTTGMAAWRIKVVNEYGNGLTVKQALTRLCLALPLCLSGIGLLWALIDKDKQTLYDRLAKTKLIKI